MRVPILTPDCLYNLHSTTAVSYLANLSTSQVVSYIKALSPGQRAGYILMNETQEAVRAGMHEPLRMEVGEEGERT
jgi:hypothetical protein